MSNEQKQPQEGKPLTAEEMVSKESEFVKKWGRMVLDSNAEMIAENYAAQQTAALREELAIVREQHSNEGAQKMALQEKLDIADENEQNLRVELESVKEQLKDERREYKAEKETRVDTQKQLEEVERYAVELKSQLEHMKKEWDSLRGTATKSWIALNFERNEHKKVRDQLSEVTRQRNEAADLLREYGCVKPDHEEVAWHKRYIAFIRSLSSGETKPAGFEPGEQTIVPNLSQEQKTLVVTDCVEKASELLLRVFMFCDFKTHIETDIVNEATGHKYRLSFIRKDVEQVPETRPASPWISVEDRLPEISNDMSDKVITLRPGQVDLDHYHKDGYWMMDYEDVLTTHWMPLPAPPESLT